MPLKPLTSALTGGITSSSIPIDIKQRVRILYCLESSLFSFSVLTQLREESEKCSGCYGRTDNTCYVRSHSVHE